MSEQENEAGVPDEQLPDDLVPGEENPLADGLEDGESVEGLLDGGKDAEESEQADASEQEPETD